MSKKVLIIGGGIGGLGTACLLAKRGFQVELFEKNEKLGGRCNIFSEQGFTFDMGPSWYLMPEVFERFLELTGEKIEDHLKIIKLEPSYKVYFKENNKVIDVKTNPEDLQKLIEELEPGTYPKFQEYLKKASEQYTIAMEDFIYKSYDDFKSILDPRLATKAHQFSLFSSMQSYVEKYFKSPTLQKLLQYQLVFLGSSPYNTPALYKIMSHIDFAQGVFFPKGGMYKITEAIVNIAKKLGVKLHIKSNVDEIIIKNKQACGIKLNGQEILGDIVISNSDIQHNETKLIKEKRNRQYSQKYWDKRTLAPSAVILYLGVKGKIKDFRHHNLIFSADWQENFKQIFDQPQWPTDPSLYICNPNKTDPEMAPADHENLFVFVPIASGLDYTDDFIKKYSQKIIENIAKTTGITDLQERIVYQKIFSVKDFESRYNSFQGTALGLAHTLWQTAIMRPTHQHKKIKNHYRVGGNNNPGIGLPMVLISAELVANKIKND